MLLSPFPRFWLSFLLSFSSKRTFHFSVYAAVPLLSLTPFLPIFFSRSCPLLPPLSPFSAAPPLAHLLPARPSHLHWQRYVYHSRLLFGLRTRVRLSSLTVSFDYLSFYLTAASHKTGRKNGTRLIFFPFLLNPIIHSLCIPLTLAWVPWTRLEYFRRWFPPYTYIIF